MVGPCNKCDRRCRSRRTGSIGLRHCVGRSLHRRCSQDISNLSAGSPLLPKASNVQVYLYTRAVATNYDTTRVTVDSTILSTLCRSLHKLVALHVTDVH